MRSGTAYVVAFLAVIALVSAAGAASAATEANPVTVWAADSLTKIDPTGKPIVYDPVAGYRDKNAVWDAEGGEVSIEAAKNEYVAFQIMIDGGQEGLVETSVNASDLVSPGGVIAAANFTLFGEYVTNVTRPSTSPAHSLGPGWYPDGLVPLSLPDYSKFKVAPGRTQGVWADLYVPKDAPAGRYAGTVTVAASGRAPVVVKVALEVWDFALPAESHLRWRIGYNEALAEAHEVPFSRQTSKVTKEFLDLELDFYRFCRRHRITPTTHYTTPIPDHTGSGEDLKIDWASYDRRFGRYLDGTAFDDGVPVNVFSLPVNSQSYGGWPSSTRPSRRSGDLGAVALPLANYKADLESFRKALELTVQHWDEKGWDLGDGFVYVADEPGGGRYSLIQDHCRVIREVDERIHRSVAFYRAFGTNGRKIVEDFREYVNYWEIAGDYMDRTALEGLRERGDWVGIYQGSAPFEGGEALDMDGVALVTWPWIAWMYDLDSLFIYMGMMWGDKDIWEDPNNQGWPTNSQGVLFYPGLKFGVKRVLPAIRTKQMRRGMQDYEYMWLLKEAGKKDVADRIVKGILHAAFQDASPGKFGDNHYGKGKWEHDAAMWIEARREMARAILAPREGADAPEGD